MGTQDFTNSVTYTVTAEDEITTQDWVVTVTEAPNAIPTVANAMSDQEEEAGFGTTNISYDGVFEDSDGDNLEISVESSAENVVTAQVIANNQIEITEVGLGTSTITITADDGNGGMISDEFIFTVTENDNVLGLDQNLNIRVYPNPATHFINIYI